MSKNKKPIILSFDGNIGSGKSTIVKYLESNFENYCNHKNTTNNLKICFLQEPVSIWEKIIDQKTNKNLIECFYSDNEKYSFAFQMMAYISRLSIFNKALAENYDVIITERSLFTDKNIFAKMLYDTDKMNSVEYQIYLKWFDEFTESLKDIKIVYIKTAPETCFNRIIKRNRKGENITMAYLNNCHLYHELWLNNIENDRILTIDGNIEVDINVSFEYFNLIMEKVYNFII